MCFIWISEQTAIISLYSINRLAFITEAERVYCAVRTGYLNQSFVLEGLKFKEVLLRTPANIFFFSSFFLSFFFFFFLPCVVNKFIEFCKKFGYK